MLATILAYSAVIFVVLGAVLGFRRQRKHSLLRLITVAASLVLAYLISAPIANGIDTEALLASVPQLAEALAAVPSLLPFVLAVFRPLVFCILFFALHLVTFILYLILSHFVGYTKKEKGRPILAALFGTVQGLLVAAVLLTSVLGYVTLADDAITAYTEAGGATTREEASYDLATLQKEQLAPVRENTTLRVMGQVTAPLFEMLSSAKIGEKDVSLSTELPVLLKTYGELSVLKGKEPADFGDAEAEALRSLSDLLEESEFIPAVTAELLSAVTTKWVAGEPFLGMEKPTMEADLDPLFTEMLTVFKTSTADSVKADLDTVVELFVLMIDHDVLKTEAGEEIFDKVTAVHPETGKTFIKAATELLDANPHFAPLRTAIMDLGARMVISQLGTPEEIRENCEPMVGEIVDILKNAEGDTNEEKIAALTPTLREELTENGITVSDEVVDEASRFLLDELESEGKDLGTLTNDDIFDILDGLAAKAAS